LSEHYKDSPKYALAIYS